MEKGYSPTSVLWIILKNFELKHTKQLVEKNLKFIDYSLVNEYFIQKVHELSGGIPRILEFICILFHYYINVLKNSLDLSENKDVDYNLNIISEYILKNSLDIKKFNLEKLDKKLKKMALILYAKSISQKGFKMTDTFMQDGDSCVFSDFIYVYPFTLQKKMMNFLSFNLLCIPNLKDI
jgi:hypothetical protein